MTQNVAQTYFEEVSITEGLNICLVSTDQFPDESQLIFNRIQNIFSFPSTSTENQKSGRTDVWTRGNWSSETGTGLVNVLYKIFKNEDNWDGFGTPKISESLKQRCFEILEIIGKNQFNFPYIFPVCGGGIQFEWKVGSKELEIEFNENEVSALRTEKFADNRCRYIEDENINLDQIPELCLWLESI